MKLFEQYKQSLKMVEAEELLDLFFYRPLGFIFVKIISPLPVTPNHISLLAMVFGIIAGFYYSMMTRDAVFIAGIYYSAYYLFDISDGQLARLKKNGSRLGRIIDGISDYVTHIAVYIGLGIGLTKASGDPLSTWVLVVAALISMMIQAVLMDYYRNRYMAYATGNSGLYGDDLEDFKREYEELKKNGGHYISRSIYWLYLTYLSFQELFSSSEKAEDIIEKFNRESFVQRNKIPIRLWTLMGTATHITLLIITSFLFRLEIYLWGIITVLNLYAIIMVIMQFFMDRGTKLK